LLPAEKQKINNFMFYIWHTILVAAFVAISFALGYKLGQKKSASKKIKF
jgi:hypothetical protein